MPQGFMKVAFFMSPTQIYGMNNTSKEVNCTNVVSYKPKQRSHYQTRHATLFQTASKQALEVQQFGVSGIQTLTGSGR